MSLIKLFRLYIPFYFTCFYLYISQHLPGDQAVYNKLQGLGQSITLGLMLFYVLAALH